ncbi:MAG: heavy-metal-associated domain-containing protein [Leeuwenhoekiella sp.]
MKTVLKIQNLHSPEGKNIIERSLSRILDMRIVEVDFKKKFVAVIYETPDVLEKIKRELWNIGFPISQNSKANLKNHNTIS